MIRGHIPAKPFVVILVQRVLHLYAVPSPLPALGLDALAEDGVNRLRYNLFHGVMLFFVVIIVFPVGLLSLIIPPPRFRPRPR